MTADSPVGPMTAPLTDSELAEYRRLTCLIEDIEQRRNIVALLRHGLRRNPARLALLDEREAQLYAGGAALLRIRAPLHRRYRWPGFIECRDSLTSH
ncbi:hypothetical protein GJ698_14980 [Pseudoduganella sp. FT26W]|uniref:Uncharacterized protein n=1 Tax=Duganella aquatilis TaxID=2666082 RepID=A0A844CZT1_9BURK|nr:hypothetical protein [Duganella aquatilis]MRW85388.1 hypothetical protein [Duganella aquatilis]